MLSKASNMKTENELVVEIVDKFIYTIGWKTADGKKSLHNSKVNTDIAKYFLAGWAGALLFLGYDVNLADRVMVRVSAEIISYCF